MNRFQTFLNNFSLLLSFDDLSIGFVKGELKIEGIRLMPDSTVFQQWKAIDSLPRTYETFLLGAIPLRSV